MANTIKQAIQSIQSGGPLNAQQAAQIRKFVGINLKARKSVAQTVTSSTVMVSDNALFAELPVGEHSFELNLHLSMAAASNINLQFAASAGLAVSSIQATVVLFADGVAPAIRDIAALATPVDGAAATIWTSARIYGSVFVTAQGVLQFQWSQKVSGGTATQVKVGSTMLTDQLL